MVRETAVGVSVFLTAEEVATRYLVSLSWVHERTRLNTIPHMKRAHTRRVLFQADHLAAWDAGAKLEIVVLDDGGRLVRPADNGAAYAKSP